MDFWLLTVHIFLRISESENITLLAIRLVIFSPQQKNWREMLNCCGKPIKHENHCNFIMIDSSRVEIVKEWTIDSLSLAFLHALERLLFGDE